MLGSLRSCMRSKGSGSGLRAVEAVDSGLGKISKGDARLPLPHPYLGLGQAPPWQIQHLIPSATANKTEVLVPSIRKCSQAYSWHPNLGLGQAPLWQTKHLIPSAMQCHSSEKISLRFWCQASQSAVKPHLGTPT